MADTKVTYITTSEHGQIGDSGPLEPGGRVLFDEENATHKYVRKLIEAEDASVAHLSVVEVTPKDEAKNAEQAKEMAVKAQELAAEARNEQAREAQEELDKRLDVAEEQKPHSGQTVFPPQDEEAINISEQAGPGQRASTQEDVVEEEKATGRKRSSRSGK
jgi:hypothetical protein